MAELHWHAATAAGKYDDTATIPAGQGALHLTAALPAGTLENATATLPWAMAVDEKLFMNGYQTWTECPELSKWDKQRGTDRIPHKKEKANDRRQDFRGPLQNRAFDARDGHLSHVHAGLRPAPQRRPEIFRPFADYPRDTDQDDDHS